MNIVFTALSVLSSITGFASGQRYDTEAYHLQDLLFEHFGELSPLADENSILMSDDVYDMGGSNRYLLLSFIDGKSVIYDKKDECILETYDVNPYLGHDDEFKLLGNIDDEYMFGYFDEEINDFTFINNTSKSKEDIRTYYGNQDVSFGNYYTNIEMPANVHIISNAYYFERLGNRHALNNDGTCAVISAEILLGYYDTFVNDTIVPEEYDQPVVQPITSSNPKPIDFSESPGVDTNSSHRFHDYLCDLSNNVLGVNPTNSGMNTKDQKRLMLEYLDERGLSYQTRCSEGNLTDLIGNKAKTVIKDAINQNRPVIACGEKHASVAYAYSDTMVWVHTGWGFVGATPWRTFESGMFSNYYSGAIDFISIGVNAHVCSDNYFASNLSTYVCAKCGNKFKLSDVSPANVGLPTTYYSQERNKTASAGNLGLWVNYKRAATSSDSSYISLSARRSNEGLAYVDIYANKAIRKLEFGLSFYNSNEALNKNNASIELFVVRRSYEGDLYLSYLENLIDYSISKNRMDPTPFVYNFTNDEIYGFSLTVCAPATGTTDSGRVCLQGISMEYLTNYTGISF